MQASREPNQKLSNSLSLTLNFFEFPNLKDLTLDSKGDIVLTISVSRERSEETIERWMKIRELKMPKPKRLQ